MFVIFLFLFLAPVEGLFYKPKYQADLYIISYYLKYFTDPGLLNIRHPTSVCSRDICFLRVLKMKNPDMIR